MSADWVTWALQFMIAAVLIWFRSNLDKNTTAINDMRESLPKTYLPKEEFETYRVETKRATHEDREKLNKAVTELEVMKRIQGNRA